MVLKFRRVSKNDDYRVIAHLIYHTDPFIYPDLFGAYEQAEKVIINLLETEIPPSKKERSIFYSDNYYVALLDDNIAGIAAFYNNVRWDARCVEDAFNEENVNIPASFGAASDYFNFTFNQSMRIGVSACNITVAEKYRGRGVATEIIGNLIKMSGNMDIELNVLADNAPAIKLYEKHGFKKIETFKDYGGYEKDKVDCIKMYREARAEQRTHADKPKTYLDMRDVREDDKYVFISYSRKDSECVYSDLRKLFSDGLKFWYDAKINAGKEWDAVVIEKIRNCNCLGAIFYMSDKLFESPSVEKEIIECNKVLKEREDFQIVPVSLGSKSVSEMIRNIYLGLSEASAKEINDRFPLTRLKNIMDTFKDNIHYIARSEESEDLGHINALKKEFKDKTLFSNDESILNMLMMSGILKKVNDIYHLEFGKYPQGKRTLLISLRNGDVERDGKKYRMDGGAAYVFEKIGWKMLSLDGYFGTFVSEYSLEMMTGGQESDDWVSSKFRETAFNDSDRISISKLSMLTKEQLEACKNIIGNTKNTEYANRNVQGGVVYVWLNDFESGGKSRCICNLSGNIVNSGMPVKNRGGIRPVITVNFKPMLELLTESSEHVH